MKKSEYLKKAKKLFDDFWYLLWKDDSLKGWIFSIAFIFLFIKFIFFPLLSLATGTSIPLAIVESCSMYHEGNYFSDLDSWWKEEGNKYVQFGITKQDFDDFPFTKGFNKGDILFVIGANPEKLEIGDVIIFNANQKHPIIHRIVEIEEENGQRIFSTFGDNNNQQLSFEKEISENEILGKAVFRPAPYVGWIKLVFFDWQNPSEKRGFC